eukprot:TRINITY_DN2557_c1_g1_i4.p1 TRINITY_DN2557_c1_g1~~TRINITY_DN2557_c1_g1_i4.p1  ORF type:complete len:234 (+),score=41.59 TRINITY_DN2557_c1_g1_i4:69-770(+)
MGSTMRIAAQLSSRCRQCCSLQQQRQQWHQQQACRALSSSEAASTAQKETHFGYKQVPESDKKGMVKGVFSSVAKDYDVMNDLMSAGVHRLWKDEFVRMLGVKEAIQAGDSPPRVLDMAGGTGDISFRIIEEMSPYLRQDQGDEPIVTVSDINPNMLEVSVSRFKSIGRLRLLSRPLSLFLAFLKPPAYSTESAQTPAAGVCMWSTELCQTSSSLYQYFNTSLLNVCVLITLF